MLKKSYIYMLLTVAALLAAACSKAPELTEPSVPTPDMTNVIKFDMLETKVTNDDIKDQEFIIYDYVDGVQYIDGSNYTLRYSESDGAWRFYENESGNAVDFFWTETGTHEFFAYNKVNYYWSDGLYDSYKVSLNFDYSEKCLKPSSYIRLLYPTSSPDARGLYQDLICATTTRNVSEDGYGPVEIRFNHMFASVKFTFQNNSLTYKTISNLSITNLYHSTGISTRLYFDGSQTLDFESAGTYEFPISATVPNGEAWDAFGTVIVLPQDLGGLTEEIVWYEGEERKSLLLYNDLGATYWDAGRLYHYVITLNPKALELEPEATIEHEKDAEGNIVKSAVVVTLGAKEEDFARITDLVITVKKDDTICKTYSAATVDSNIIRVSEGDVDILEPGIEYTVTVQYYDGLDTREHSTTVKEEVVVVQPQVGYYINSDGTFSETFVSGESIAKIFWIGSLSSDTQLVSDYPYLAAEGTDHGLAYEVDETTGNLKELSGTGWGKGTYSEIGSNNAYYDSINNWNGYSCTFIIQQVSTSGFINQNIGEGYQVCPNTSSWFIPSIAEIEAVIQSGVTPSTNLLWTSTMYSGYFGAIECYTYNWSTDTKNRQTATAAYITNKYFRILAF